MGRAALGWSLEVLSEKTGISVRTLRRFESGEAMPRRPYREIIRNKFEEAGIKFLARGGIEPPPDA
jgi:ribosome-binding protein aMBF1 (putative translation factor)